MLSPWGAGARWGTGRKKPLGWTGKEAAGRWIHCILRGALRGGEEMACGSCMASVVKTT